MKVKTLAQLKPILKALRKGKRTIVFTNGCFDLIHVGHVRCLRKARSMGDVLIVGLNTDSSVRRIKPGRPLVPERERAEVLSALEMVDYVVLFPETTPLRLIRGIRPDVLVKGGDYRRGEVVGADVVEAAGGRTVVVPLVRNRSTSGLLARIRARTCP